MASIVVRTVDLSYLPHSPVTTHSGTRKKGNAHHLNISLQAQCGPLVRISVRGSIPYTPEQRVLMKQSTAWALLALACLVPRGHHAFTTNTHRPLATISSRSRPLKTLADEDIEELQKETDEALRAAKKAIEDVDERMAQAELKRKQQAAAAIQAERLSDAIASGVSGAAIGAVLGILALIEFPDLAPFDPLLPPLATSIVLGGAAFATANTDNAASPIVRNTLGKGLKSLGDAAGNAVKNSVQSAWASVAAIPGKLASAAQQKAKATADEIAAIPGKLVDAAEQKARDTAETIAAIPVKLADAAEQKAKDTAETIAAIPGRLADAAEQKAKETAETIAAIPVKLADATEKKVKETVEEIERIPDKLTKAAEQKVKETTQEIKELPVKLQDAASQKLVEVSEEIKQDIKDFEASIGQKVEEVVEEVKAFPQEITEEIQKDVSKVMPAAPKLPVPPKMPPPQEAQLLKPPKSEKPPKPIAEQPIFVAPKIELPQISLPKAELPKIPSPPLIPTPPKKAPPKKKEEDKFVFSEVSLKQFIQEVKPADKDFARKQDEAKRKADEERKVAAERAEAERVAKARADAEARKKAAEEKRVDAERKEEERQAREEQLRREAEAKKAALLRAKQAQESVQKAKPRSTFSLTSLFGLSEDEDTAAAPSAAKVQTRKAMAPPGVPIITGWKQNRDGSISGRIIGASGFKDGEKIETSPVTGAATSGSVVQTASGSR